MISAICASVYSSGTPRRSLDTVASTVNDVFVQSALIARGWVDPSQRETDTVFKTMIESVVSGKQEPGQAIFEAASQLRALVLGKE